MKLVLLKFFNEKSGLRNCALGGAWSLFLAVVVFAQAVPYARTYQKPREEVEAALKEMQAYSGQKLPIIDGFVAAGDQPLDRYERAFYQFSIELIPGNSGSTVVQVTAKITAWYADRDPAKSGYQVLPSNGRLELDLLDRLDGKLGAKLASSISRAGSNSTIIAPKPKLDLGDRSTRIRKCMSLIGANIPALNVVLSCRHFTPTSVAFVPGPLDFSSFSAPLSSAVRRRIFRARHTMLYYYEGT